VAVNSQSIAHEIVPAPMITASVPDVPTIIDDITHGVPIPTAIVSKIKFIDDVASESPIYDIVNSSKGSTPTIEHVFVLPPETELNIVINSSMLQLEICQSRGRLCFEEGRIMSQTAKDIHTNQSRIILNSS
jgi:hypothetical protein